MNGRRIVVDANIAFRALSRGRNDLAAMLRPAGLRRRQLARVMSFIEM